MKLAQMRKYRQKPILSPELIPNNPVLLLCLDIPFVVVGANTLKNAAVFSIEMFFIHIITMIVGRLITKKLKIWQRFIVTTITASIVMVFAREFAVSLIPNYESTDSMYLYLMAMNGMTILQSNFLKDNAKFKSTIKSAFLNVLSFSIIMFFFSFIREYFGNGTLWGQPMPVSIRLTGFRSPFFGFIMLGGMLALVRFINRQLSILKIMDRVRRENIPELEEL